MKYYLSICWIVHKIKSSLTAQKAKMYLDNFLHTQKLQNQVHLFNSLCTELQNKIIKLHHLRKITAF